MTAPLDTVSWIHGAADCNRSTDPLLQVYQFDADTVILRESKCFSYEGNFIYLLFGDTRALLLDTGGPVDPVKPWNHGKVLPLRQTVDGIIAGWVQKRGGVGIDLAVAHTHSHLDHCAWDKEFSDRPRTTIVEPSLAAVQAFFGLPNWPDGEATLELGNRSLIVFPIPGHQSEHIAIYDPRNTWLLTGDMLYPGLLTIAVGGWNAYRQSAARLAQFARTHAISDVLGCHIEMKKAPGQLYDIGTTFQPDEHALPLTVAHIDELHAACEAMGSNPHEDVHDDFIIYPPQ